MKTYIKTITEEHPLLVIEHEEASMSPREDTNIGLFLTKEINYISPDGTDHELHRIMIEAGAYARNCTDHMNKIRKQAEEEISEKILLIVPVSKHEHGGVVYKRGEYQGFDYGVSGCYIVTDKTWAECFGDEPFNEQKALEFIDEEIRIYNQYMNGEMYQFKLYNTKGYIVDRCGGFYDIEDIREHLPDDWLKEDLNDYLID